MRKKFLGTLFLVVGNSGSGKDSIIKGVAKKYPLNLKRIYAPKRYITRPPSKTEENISITSEEFKKKSENGEFALQWHIYGLFYGIPIEIEDWLKNGHPVAVNVSRTIVDYAKKRYENVKVIFIEVPFEISLKRLKERGREKGELLEKRLERARKNQKFSMADFMVDNSGDLEDAINRFLNIILETVKKNEK